MKKRIYSLIITASMFFSILPVKAELINPDSLATDGKVVKNVALNKNAYRAKDKSSLSGWTNGVENDDGQFSEVNWLQGYGSGDYGIVDLNKPYSIAAVGIMSTEMPWHHAPAEIYGTNDSSCSLNGAELIATITLEDAQSSGAVINDAIRKSVVRANGGKYRYILFSPGVPSGDGLIAKEVFVYTCLGDEFGEWNIADNGEERSFEMPVTYINPSEEKTFTMAVVNYNEEGFMTGYSETEASGSPLSSSVDVTANDTKSQAILFYNGNPVSDAGIGLYGFDGFSAEKGTAVDFESAVSNYAGEDYSVIEGKSVQSSDTITVKVVKSDEEMAEEALSNAQSIYWYGAVKSGNGYSFKIPFSEGGQYYIEVTRYNKSGESESKYYKYNMIDTALRQACVDSFMDFEPDGQNSLSDCITEAVDNLGIITESSLINRSAAQTSEFAQTFADIRDIMADSEVNSDDLIKILNTATVVYFLKQDDNSYMSQYGYLIEGEVKSYVEEELGYSFDADVKAEFDTNASVTNIDADGRLIFSFTGAEMDEATLTSKNIILEKNGAAVEYEFLSADSGSVSIDKAILETGAEYKISFGSGCLTKDGKRMSEVKSFKFTAGEIVNIPYKEGKIIKNVTLDKPVSGVVDTSWKEEPNSIITDGKTDKSVLFESNETIVIDLKDYYDICALNFSGDEPGMGRWYHNTGVSAMGSDISSEFKDGEYSILFRYSESQSEVEKQLDCIQTPVYTGKVRFLALRKNDSTGILMREIKAYAYVDTEFGPWETESFNGAGEYTFTIPVNENVKDNTYCMLLSAYDQNGQLLKTVAQTLNSSAGVLEAKINAPEGSVGITASVVSDIETMCALTDSVTIGECIEIDTEAPNGFKVNGTDNGLTIDIALSGEIKKSSRVVVTAVKTTETGKSAKDAYTQMSADELEENTVFLYAGKCGNGVKLSLDNLSEGKYYINTAVSSLDGSVKNIYYKYTVITNEARQDIVSDFMSADETAIAGVVNDALNVREVISSDALADTSDATDATYNKLLVYTRDLLYTEAEKAQADKLSDVIDIMNAASLVKALYDADAEKTKEIAADYASLLGQYYDSSVDTAKLTAVFGDIKDNIKDAKSLGEVLNWSKLLSFMKNATSADIAQAMRKYEAELGIDVDYASEKKVSLERTADFMDFNNMKALFGKTAFNNAYKAAADRAGSNGSGGGSSSRPVSGGGGGVGISGGSSQSGTGNNVINPVDKGDTSVVFADMTSYLWANDAVKALKEKVLLTVRNTVHLNRQEM